MPRDTYPALEVGKESGFKPTRLRMDGRNVTVVGAYLDGGKAVWDNGVLHGKSQVEQGINFGPEILRAMKGRRIVALFLSAAQDAEGRDGWHGLTAGEMRVDTPAKDGFKDPNAFGSKLTESARGRVTVFQLKPEDRPAIAELLGRMPELWRNANRAFRDTLLGAVPSLIELDAAGTEVAPEIPGAPRVDLGTADGVPPQSLRMAGRDVTVVGAVVDGSRAYWDNGLLVRQSKIEKGITFGPEPLRALGGRRVCGLWVAVAGEEGEPPGYFGVTVGTMRVDENKRDGFKDLNAHSMKLNDAARGRIELGRLLPPERKAVAALLQERPELWEHAAQNVRDALDVQE